MRAAHVWPYIDIPVWCVVVCMRTVHVVVVNVCVLFVRRLRAALVVVGICAARVVVCLHALHVVVVVCGL